MAAVVHLAVSWGLVSSPLTGMHSSDRSGSTLLWDETEPSCPAWTIHRLSSSFSWYTWKAASIHRSSSIALHKRRAVALATFACVDSTSPVFGRSCSSSRQISPMNAIARSTSARTCHGSGYVCSLELQRIRIRLFSSSSRPYPFAPILRAPHLREDVPRLPHQPCHASLGTCLDHSFAIEFPGLQFSGEPLATVLPEFQLPLEPLSTVDYSKTVSRSRLVFHHSQLDSQSQLDVDFIRSSICRLSLIRSWHVNCSPKKGWKSGWKVVEKWFTKLVEKYAEKNVKKNRKIIVEK